MKNHVNQSTQDYLKNIYDLNRDGHPATTNNLAMSMHISPASVTGMIQKLANSKPPLVIYKKHRGVTLTKDGECVALEVIRHHRLLETFLVRTLGYNLEEVHEEACRLEHVISEEFEARIDSALGNPSQDPHGSPIPGKDLSMPSIKLQRMGDMRRGESAIIRRVPDDDSSLLRHLLETGVIPGAKVTVENYSDFDGYLTLLVEGLEKPIVLGTKITNKIYIGKDEK